MKKINKFVIIYFLAILPLILATMIFGWSDFFFNLSKESSTGEFLNSLIGSMWGIWMLCTVYLVVSLIFSTNFREELVARMVFLRERDEREVQFAGSAAKKTFFMSVAIISFLFVISLFQIELDKLPETEAAKTGHHHSLKLGFNYHVWDSSQMQSTDQIFNFHFPITTSGILLFLLVCELSAFTWYSRKELEGK